MLPGVPDRLLVFGHRGAPAVAPENTLAGFSAAAAAGADGVELDVRALADGTLVVFHDDTLDRCTGGSGVLAALAWDDVAGLVVGKKAGAGEHIPRLDEALDHCAGQQLLVNVELKNLPGRPGFDPTSAMACRVAERIAERGATDTVFLSSFFLDDLVAARARVPSVAAVWLTLGGYDPLDAFDRAHAAGLSGVHPDHRALAGDVAARVGAMARTAGAWLGTWTVDDPAEMRRFAAAGLRALITNDPAAAVAVTSGR